MGAGCVARVGKYRYAYFQYDGKNRRFLERGGAYGRGTGTFASGIRASS